MLMCEQEDITALVATSFMLRETSMRRFARRVARKAMNASTPGLERKLTMPALDHRLEGCISRDDTKSMVAVQQE
jgi:hypothetical protein